MKKIILNIFAFIFFFTAFFDAKAQFTNIYIGSDTLSSNYPYTTYWMDGRTDMLYTANEIIAGGGSAGYFVGMAFYINHADTLTMNGFNIKMQNTGDTALTGFGSGWDIVYSGAYKVLDTGWQIVYFNQSFGWNGVSNVLVEICYNNNRYTWFSTVRSSVKPGKTFGVYQDLPNGDGCADLTTGALQQRRPNICLVFSPLTSVGNANTKPDKYSLSQNYPNPFNPETRINYSIPKAGFVTLKIYDMLGRETATLVNEYKGAGNYITEFNASALASGVYFYRIVTDRFTDTKKMMVVIK